MEGSAEFKALQDSVPFLPELKYYLKPPHDNPVFTGGGVDSWE